MEYADNLNLGMFYQNAIYNYRKTNIIHSSSRVVA